MSPSPTATRASRWALGTSASSRPPADERQGRTLYPDAQERVGLRAHLRQLRRTHGSAVVLLGPLQLQTSTRLSRPQAAGVTADERRWELHLEIAPGEDPGARG